MGVGLLIVHPCDALRAVALRISAVRRADFSTHCNLAAAAVCGRSYSRSTQNSRFSLVKSQCCKVKQSRDFNMPAAEDTNCCRLAPHPNAASDLAEGQSGVLIDNNGEWVDPTLLLTPVCLTCGRCAMPAGPETLHDASSDTSNNMLLTRKRYKDLSKQELKELQLTLLVDLQRLVRLKLQTMACQMHQLAHHPVVCHAGDECSCACGRGNPSNRQATLCSTICNSQEQATSGYGFLFQVWAGLKCCDLELREA